MASDQHDLFGLGTPEKPTNPIEARFWKFHAENPHVYVLFDRFTRDVIRRGYEYFSADMVMHRLRWETSIETTETQRVEGARLKLNDHFVAYYSRLWMRNNPAHAGLFRTRALPNGRESERLQEVA